MHDLDRTRGGYTHLEASFGQRREDESEFQAEQEQQFSGEVLHEEELDELAAELLEVSSEQELEQFLGDLVKKVGAAAGTFIKSPVGQKVVAALKEAAKETLPAAGAVLGNMVVPGAGGLVGSQIASGIGSMLGLELEGLSYEDGEFEVAKQFVRLAADTAHTAGKAAPTTSPRDIASQALNVAAQKYAPGLLSELPSTAAANSGRWVREGRKLILYGA